MKTENGKEIAVKVVGNSVFGRYKKISSEKNYNTFTSDGWSVGFSGYKRVGEWPEANARGRGAFVSARSDIAIAVIGSTVILIDSNLVANRVGTLESSPTLVTFAENLNGQICICDSLDAYIYNIAQRSLTKQNITSFIPNTVDFHDTYFVFGNKDFTSNGAKWYVYRRATDTTIEYVASPALETKADHALSVIALPAGGSNVLVIGKTVSEVQTDVGAASINIYARVSSFSINYGTVSVSSIASNSDRVCFLGSNKNSSNIIVSYSVSEGFRKLMQIDERGMPRNDGIDYLVQSIKYPELSFGYFMQRDGHDFYIITFPHEDDNCTIYYDFNSKGYGFLTDQNNNFYPPVDVVNFNKNSYFVSYNNSSIYQIGTEFVTYDENITLNDESKNYCIPRYRICDNFRISNSDQFIANLFRLMMENGNDVQFNALTISENVTFLTDESGNVLTTENNEPLVTEDSFIGIPYVPKVDLSFSIDGGHTWSIYISNPLNFDAFRQSIVQWEKLGRANDIVLKLAFWMKSAVMFSNGVLEVRK